MSPTVPFLSEEWRRLFLTEADGVPGLVGATGRFELLISRPNGTTGAFVLALVDGHLTDIELGSPTTQADLRVEMPEEDLIRLFAGETDAFYRAYWTGRMRATGDMAKTATMAPLLDTEGFRALLRRMLEQTEFVQ